MLSKTTKHAIRAVLHIAQNTSETNLIGLALLSKKLNISKDTLAKVLQQLTKRDFIHLINTFESSENIFSTCLLGQDKCPTTDMCPYHKIVVTIRTELAMLYSSNTILETAIKLP